MNSCNLTFLFSYFSGVDPKDKHWDKFSFDIGGPVEEIMVSVDSSEVMINIPPGGYTIASLRKEDIFSVNNPPEFVCNNNQNYTRKSDCTQKCMKNRLDCFCERFGSSNERRKPICSPWELSKCTPEKDDTFSSCFDTCLEPCHTERLNIRTRTLDFDPVLLSFKPQFLGNLSLESFMSKRAIIEIAYEKMEYTEIRQFFAMTEVGLVSNMGGIMGLLLGGSMLTLIHFVVFALRQCCMCKSERELKIATL